ncbi:MAG: uroporphyrinogen-III C-methyltransferase [Nitrosomonadaceae bacterium]|nr:uroporphyrinogen-III C-methyltransferase [Nitrosomonadaceae bacterium]|tara:strand:+ start:338 stop:1762 length:1425 start_codon:yes stop_codon:yes gene_type:complete
MDFLPIFINIRDRNCLVVGGGKIAARKIDLLLNTGACITVVAPDINKELLKKANQGVFIYRAESFTPDHIKNVSLVIAATNNLRINKEVSETAQKLGIPVNVVDNLDLCSFIVPSILNRSPVLIAVSSSGKSPVLARLLRAHLETIIPEAYGRIATYAANFRERVKQHFSYPERRRLFWEKELQGPFVDMVLAGKDEAAQNYLEQSLCNETDETPTGEVYLVGAGPGNPDLLTFRAMRLMQQADVVVYDRLVSPEILNMVRQDAERIYAGKEHRNHSMSQESINELLVRLAKENKRVLRLKGGDPFIFGRGGEEIESLANFGIPFQVVPGITAASGVAAYAGIPLTHRDYAQSCIFVTGHLKNNNVDLDWPALVKPNQTIVIYMGLLGLSVLCNNLISNGLPERTPAAIIQQGTTRNQRVLIGSLDTLPGLAHSSNLTPPTLIIIGEVVNLHQSLTWFDSKHDPNANNYSSFKK